MDVTLFGPNSPGNLIRISAPWPDWAFIPGPIPKNWQPTPELVPLLVDARQCLARLDGAARYLPANTYLLRPLQQREALRSSALEGTYATAEQLLLYGLEPKEPTSSSDPANAWREVFNYDSALQRAEQLLRHVPIASRVMKELHSRLLEGVRGADRTPGVFRRRQVHIGSDRRFVPAPHDQVEDCIAKLERYINEPDNTDPLVRTFMAHYQFEAIHPFLDGNGRVGRLLLAVMIHRACSLQAPWLYLSPYFDKHKDEYIDRLFQVSTKGDWNSWIALCLRGTIEESRNALMRIDNLIKLKDKYEKQLAKARSSARLQQMVVHLLSSPVTTISALARQFDITFPTAQADVRRLMKLRILKQMVPRSKPMSFIAHEFFKAAYLEELSF
ncbi:MAG: Fic family protein [Steroidobacteraceae bacterium]